MVLATGTVSPLCQAFVRCSFFLEQPFPALHLVNFYHLPITSFGKPSLVLLPDLNIPSLSSHGSMLTYLSSVLPLRFITGISLTWLPNQSGSPQGVTSSGCLSQVIKNRIHSFRAYGIAVRGRAKALVQENIIFQGKTSKTIFQQISNNRECIMQNNKFLVFKKK